jgi:hypothetical protein
MIRRCAIGPPGSLATDLTRSCVGLFYLDDAALQVDLLGAKTVLSGFGSKRAARQTYSVKSRMETKE